MPKIGLGTKIFSRTEKLETLLESVSDTPIDTVYIADDGEQNENKYRLYDGDYDFELEVLELKYDAGLGQGRNRIVEESDEPYLLIVDTDHEIPSNVDRLVDQLEARPDLGGIAGLLLERKKIRGTCHDIHERDDILLRDVRGNKEVQRVSGEPFVQYDFVPNACLFRRTCLEEQMWDPYYTIGKEHIDFYVSHYKKTDWSFGINPTVLFNHNPGGDSAYISDRENLEKLHRSKEYFLNKWGYRGIVLGQTDWTDATRSQRSGQHLSEQLLKKALVSLPPSVQYRLMRLRSKVRRQRNRPPL